MVSASTISEMIVSLGLGTQISYSQSHQFTSNGRNKHFRKTQSSIAFGEIFAQQKSNYLLGLLYKRKLLQGLYLLDITSLPSARNSALCAQIQRNPLSIFFFIAHLLGKFGLLFSDGGDSIGFVLLILPLYLKSSFHFLSRILKRNAGILASSLSSGLFGRPGTISSSTTNLQLSGRFSRQSRCHQTHKDLTILKIWNLLLRIRVACPQDGAFAGLFLFYSFDGFHTIFSSPSILRNLYLLYLFFFGLFALYLLAYQPLVDCLVPPPSSLDVPLSSFQ